MGEFSKNYKDYNKVNFVNVANNDVGTQMLDKLTRIKSVRRIQPLDMYNNVLYEHRAYYDEYCLQLGDTAFMIPPEFIMVTSESTTESIVTLRQENTMKEKHGHHRRTILIDLVFNTLEQLNGFKVQGPEGYYYVDGLRPLLAQFKCAPFLPIMNELINGTYGIFAVALQSIVISDVYGFPDTMKAQLTLQEVNMFPYLQMPDICFRDMIDWDLFRFYYQRFLTETHKYKKLQSLPTNKEDNHFKISILDHTVFDKATEYNIFDVVTDQKILKTNQDGTLADTNYTVYINQMGTDIVSFQCGYTNLLTNLQLQDMSTPTLQYLGGMDTIYNITFETKDTSLIQALEQVQIKNDSLIRNNPKIQASIGFVKLESELVEFTGSLFVMIESVATNTVPGFPDLYNVQINCVAFDIAQSEREQLNGFRPFDDYLGTGTKVNQSASYKDETINIHEYEYGVMRKAIQDNYAEWMINSKLEVYPDLHLPTYKEVNDVIKKINAFRAKNGFPELPYTEYPTRPMAMVHGQKPGTLTGSGNILHLRDVQHQNGEYDGYVDPDFYVFYPGSYNSYYQEDPSYYDSIKTPTQQKSKTVTMTGVDFYENAEDGTVSNDPIISGGSVEQFVQLALQQKGKKYVTGATGPDSFDCSGLITYCLRTLGVSDKRYTTATIPTSPDVFQEISINLKERGDILWREGHVAIYLGDNKLVHASNHQTGVIEQDVYSGFTKCYRIKALSSTSGITPNLGSNITQEEFERICRTVEGNTKGNSSETAKKAFAQLIFDRLTEPNGDFSNLSTILTGLGNESSTYIGITETAVKDVFCNNSKQWAGNKVYYFVNSSSGVSTGAMDGSYVRVGTVGTNIYYGKAVPSESKTFTIGASGGGYVTNGYVEVNDAFLDLIIGFEGFIGTATPKDGGMDIGYGFHNQYYDGTKWVSVKSGMTMTETQARQYLKAGMEQNWIPKTIEQIKSAGWDITQFTNNQVLALASYFYNRGISSKSTAILNKANSPTITDIGNNLPKYWGSNASAKNGLIDRRTKEKALFFSDASGYVSDTDYSSQRSDESMDSNSKVIDVIELQNSEDFAEPLLINAEHFSNYKNKVTKEYIQGVNSTVNNYNTAFVDEYQYSCRGRLVKAFPAYLFCILDENATWYDGRKLWTNYYTHQSVVDIQVHKANDMPTETATVLINNSYHNLDRTQEGLSSYDILNDKEYWQGGILGSKLTKMFYEWSGISLVWGGPKLTSNLIKLHQVIYAHAKLREGARVHIRMGYGSDPLSLAPMINGFLSDVSIGDQISMVVTSDGNELINEIVSSKENDDNNGFLGLFGLGEAQEPSNIIQYYLCQRQSKWNYVNYKWGEASMYRIEHYGTYIHENLGEQLYEWGEKDHRPQMDILCNVYRANYLAELYIQNDVDGMPGDGEDNVVFNKYNMTPWDMFQVCTQVVPEYIVKSGYFQFDSRLYFGIPFWQEKYRYDVLNVKFSGGRAVGADLYYETKTAAQVHFLDSMENIIDDQIRVTSKFTHTNIKVMYIRGSSAVSTMTIHSDDTIDWSKQNTKILDTPIVQDALGPDLLWEIFGYKVGHNSARRTGISNLIYGWNQQYQGSIICTGIPGMKPNDYIMLNDAYSNMFGICFCREVVHSFNTNTGFCTSVTPGLCAFSTDQNSGLVEATKNYLTLLASFASYTFTKRGMYQNYEEMISVFADMSVMRDAVARLDRIESWNLARDVLSVTGTAVTAWRCLVISRSLFQGVKLCFQSAKVLKEAGGMIRVAQGAIDAIKALKGIKGVGNSLSAVNKVKHIISGMKLGTAAISAEAAPATGGLSVVVGAVIEILIWLIVDVLLDMAIEYFENKNTVIILPLWWENYPFACRIKDGKNILLIPVDGEDPNALDD